MIRHLSVFILFIFNVSSINFPPMNLFIGTGGEGYGAGSIPAAAQSPYGALRVGPDTSNTLDIPIEFHHYGGYHYSDTHINILSHTHTFGAGLQDYGEVGLFPVQIENKNHLEHLIKERHNYRSTFTHERETFEPGYYQVYLETHKVNVELTATEQAAIHRYSFDDDDKKSRVILIDTSYTLSMNACRNSQVNIISNKNQINGFIRFEGDFSRNFGGVTTYFVIDFGNWSDYGVWVNGSLVEQGKESNGCASGAYIILPNNQQQVTIYVGISFISVEQALLNLQMQSNFQSFDTIRQLVQENWLREISRFQVNSSWNRDAEIKFNTAIVHSLSSPTIWDESNGVYLGFDSNIHVKPDFMDHFYTDLSIWDIFRTQIPFLIFHDSKRANDIIHSIMLIVEQGGDLPKWPFANGYVDCMIGSHSDIMLSDLFMKRENNSYFNATQIVLALRRVANEHQKHDSRFDPSKYTKYEYVPYELNKQSAALTLSYSYDDWAIGNVMYSMGLTDESEIYYNRSKWFENVFNNETKFFCARTLSGEYSCPSNEIEYLNPFDNRYVEGDAWHYRFFVPHNVPRLIELFGGSQMFVNELDQFFRRGRSWPSTILPNPYYWPGNEHDLFSVWEFNYANRSDLTQEHARWLLDNAYTTKPAGIPGNDDYGTMSAWFIFTSLGFYPLAGSSTYLFGSPAFDRVTIHRNNNQCTLNIIVHDNSPKNIYVKRVLLNGQVLSTFPFLDHVKHLRCSNESSDVQIDIFMSSTA